MALFDCQSCGACCTHGGEVSVELDEAGTTGDVPRYMTRSVRGLMGYFSDDYLDLRRMARTADDACVAFRGKIGDGCRCSIYDKRPRVCREFEAGSAGCLDARQVAGL